MNPLMSLQAPGLRRLAALVWRELLEFRGMLVYGPFAVVALVLIFGLLGVVLSEKHMVQVDGAPLIAKGALAAMEDPQYAEKLRVGLDVALWAVGLLVHLTLGLTVFFYALSATYDERKDRSILFWRSLPTSDLEAVAAKLLTALVVAPAIALLALVILQLGTLLVVALGVSLREGSAWTLILSKASPLNAALRYVALYLVNMLWLLPLVGWLFLVGVWAGRVPFLWATLGPVLLFALNQWAHWFFNVPAVAQHFLNLLGARAISLALPIPPEGAGDRGRYFDQLSKNGLPPWTDPFTTLTDPNLWIGAVIGIAMLAGAVWIRRRRDEG
ncbi:MAG: hypothetical protein MUE46_12580 [Xanthomonadales bacterium]|jgi:ABC-2 type transport system permease protein|nr:hypothetical protein [Xanthomonadales bacterium]